MTQRTAATRYSRALLEVAIKEQADLSQVEADLASFTALFDATPALSKALLNPVVPSDRKRATIEAMLSKAPLATNVGKLLVLLASRDRFALLHDILDTFRERLMDHQHVVRAAVTTAEPIAAEKARTIEESLARATGRRVVMSTAVDPSIVGGLVAKVGSTVYDGSVTTQLQRLKQRLEESV